ncbi:MAG: SpoIID/LytB domain-containing protein [Firmicutes bacterium]|nr:SpoIID/LytB domain-containing protein [Bacillota bacterium]
MFIAVIARQRYPVVILLTLILVVSLTPGAKAASLIRVGISVTGSTVILGGTGTIFDPQSNVVAYLTDTSTVELVADQGKVWLRGVPFSSLHVVPTQSDNQNFLRINDKTYRGELVVTASSSGIKVVNELDVEDYLLGVVALEMAPTWPLEALKAQAVAARTFALKNLGRHRVEGFDLCDASHCQVYGGVDAERPMSSAAVKSTNNLVLRYDDELIDAYYHASSGGRTETAGGAWGQDRPYLTVVEDGDRLAGPYASWQESFTPEELSERLAQAGYSVGLVDQVEIVATTSSGRAATVKVKGSYGTVLIPGASFRQALGLKSTLFQVNDSGLLSSPGRVTVWVTGRESFIRTAVAGGTHVITAGGIRIIDSRAGADTISRGGNERMIVLQGSGYGHGVGMSQWGAKILAENEAVSENDFFRWILTHYYKGVTIEPY